MHDPDNPNRRILRECFAGQPIGLPPKGRLHGLSDVALFIFGQKRIAERSNHALARLTLRIAVRFDKLNQWRAFDYFCPEILPAKLRGFAKAVKNKIND
ncbi:MAG: hypothetical protein ACI8Z5_002872 [Lentimonas sp.]